MQTRDAAPPSSYESGFVLVGVVMFVLALTILGLSLFALSSYEAQFTGRSYDSERALAVAQSGLENAKFVLSRRKRLADVREPAYRFPLGVVYARATGYRVGLGSPDSTLTLAEVDTARGVTIRVLANVNGERRMLQTQVTPYSAPQIYKRLITASESLYVRTDASQSSPGGTPAGYDLGGEIWEGGGPTVLPYWKVNPRLLPGWSSAPASLGSPPPPEVKAFMDQHWDDALPFQPPHNSGDHVFNDLVSPSNVTFFKTTGILDAIYNASTLYIPIYSEAAPGLETFNVTGKVVWMLRQGLRIDGHVVIHGTPGSDACLVIVSGTSKDHDTPNLDPIGAFGIEFSGGVESDIPIILVTDGWFFNEQFYPDFPTGKVHGPVVYLSVFARAVSLWGSPDFTMDLLHPAGSSEDNLGGLIDMLCGEGYLPNSESGGIQFKSVAGTWRELDPDNPPLN